MNNLGQLYKTIYVYEYMDDDVIRKVVSGSLSKIENSYEWSKAITVDSKFYKSLRFEVTVWKTGVSSLWRWRRQIGSFEANYRHIPHSWHIFMLYSSVNMWDWALSPFFGLTDFGFGYQLLSQLKMMIVKYLSQLNDIFNSEFGKNGHFDRTDRRWSQSQHVCNNACAHTIT